MEEVKNCDHRSCKEPRPENFMPFFFYSKKHWLVHARRAEKERSMPVSLLKFFYPLQSKALLDSVFGETLLHVAIRRDFKSLIRAICERQGIDVDTPDRSNRTALVLAIERQNSSAAQMLLELRTHDIDVNYQYREGYTALIIAIEKSQQVIVELLLRRSETDVNIQDPSGSSPLHLACSKAQTATVQKILHREDASFNSSNKEGSTPLHLACAGGYESIVELLLTKSEVSLNSQDKSGRSPLFAACGSRSHHGKEVVKLLLDRPDLSLGIADVSGKTPLHVACARGRPEVVKMLLARTDISINFQDHSGRTPLHEACSGWYPKTVKYLLKHPEVDVNKRDAKGDPPLSEALDSITTVKRLLRRHDIDIFWARDSGASLLATAIIHRDAPMMRWLLKHRAAIHGRNRFGKSPLYMAVVFGNVAALELLLKYGAWDDVPEEDYREAFLYVSSRWDMDHLKGLFIKYNRHPGSQNRSRGETTNVQEDLRDDTELLALLSESESSDDGMGYRVPHPYKRYKTLHTPAIGEE